MLGKKIANAFEFLEGIGRIMGELHDGLRRDATNLEVLGLELSDARIRPQPAPASYDARSPAGVLEVRGASCAVGGEVVIAQNYDGIAVLRRVRDNPESAGHTKQRRADQINERAQHHNRQQHDQFGNNSAALP